MIKIPRILTEYQLNYQNIQLFEQHEMNLVPNLFEEDTAAFYCGKELYILPRNRIILFEFKRGKYRPPENAILFKRITISYEITYQNVHLISQNDYAKYDIPIIFPDKEQFVFLTKEGIFITSDNQVIIARLQ